MKTDYFIKNKFNEIFIDNHLKKGDVVNWYQFNDSFSTDEINWIVENLTTLPSIDGVVGGDSEYVKNQNIRSSIIRWVPFNEYTEFIYERIFNMVMDANRELYNFDLWGMGENIQFTEYYEGGDHYDWHLDIGPTQTKRKISITVQLSDPEDYDGGELELKWGQNNITIPKEKGLATIFPSFILHRIKPVTRGVRRSLVLWFTGPSFR